MKPGSRHAAPGVSEAVETRSILVGPSGRRLLVAAKAVSSDWPLIGAVTTSPPGQFAALREGADGRPGLVLDPTGAQTLQVRPGDGMTLGGVPIVYRGTIADAPDRIADSRLFGVKAFVSLPALARTPLVAPGGLVTFEMQVTLPRGSTVPATVAALKARFPHDTWRISTTGDAAPDLSRFVDQAALFMDAARARRSAGRRHRRRQRRRSLAHGAGAQHRHAALPGRLVPGW